MTRPIRRRARPTPTELDDLGSASTAPLSAAPPATPPPLDGEPPAGWTETVDGAGVFVRVVDGPAGAADRAPDRGVPDAWYVHGLAGSSTNWTSLAGALGPYARGYLPDLPGHGRSDPPPRGRFSIAGFAAVLIRLIERLSSGPVHLVGNSLGGMVVIEVASRRPDLVATLTLISPAVPDLRVAGSRGADPRLALVLLPGTARVAVPRLAALSPAQRVQGMVELCFGDAAAVTAEQRKAAARDLAWRIDLPWVHTALLGSLRALIRYHLLGGSRRLRRSARRSGRPTLVVWGSRDRLVDPRLAAATAAAFPGSRLLVLAGVGHAAQMEDPATTARAIASFWREPAGAAAAVAGPPGRE